MHERLTKVANIENECLYDKMCLRLETSLSDKHADEIRKRLSPLDNINIIKSVFGQ